MPTKDRTLRTARLALSAYMRRGIADYVASEPGSSFTGAVMDGLATLGIEVDEQDRPRERSKPRIDLSSLDDNEIVGAALRLPAYARKQVERYGLDQGQTLKQVVLLGLKNLGIPVRNIDLAAPDYGRQRKDARPLYIEYQKRD